MRLVQPAAEAKKADGASCVVLRTPIPPDPVGKVAGVQVESSTRLTLRMVLRQERSSRSKDSRSGDKKHGAVLSKYITLGMAMEWCNRVIASCLEK